MTPSMMGERGDVLVGSGVVVACGLGGCWRKDEAMLFVWSKSEVRDVKRLKNFFPTADVAPLHLPGGALELHGPVSLQCGFRSTRMREVDRTMATRERARQGF